MPFKPGKPRHPEAGRKKGTPNRFTQNLMKICEEKNLDVFEALVEIALEHDSPNRFPALRELAQYLYPKRKAIEHSGEINTNPYMGKPIEELEALVREKLK